MESCSCCKFPKLIRDNVAWPRGCHARRTPCTTACWLKLRSFVSSVKEVNGSQCVSTKMCVSCVSASGLTSSGAGEYTCLMSSSGVSCSTFPPEIDTVDAEWPPINHDLFRAFGFSGTPQSPGHLEQFGFHSGTDVVCEDAGFPAVPPNDLALLLRALSVVCLTMTYNAPVNTVKSPKPVDYTTHCVCVVMVGSTRKG